MQLPAILEEKYQNCSGHTGVVLVKGISGVGKSYQAEQFLHKHEDELFILMLMPNNSYPHEYEVFNEGFFKCITSDLLAEKDSSGLPKILKEVVRAIPYTEQYLLRYVDDGEHPIDDTQFQVLTNRGSRIRRHVIPYLMQLIETLSGGKRICIYCDNIQLYDRPSFNVVMDLIRVEESDRTQEWFTLLLYTENGLSPEIGHPDIQEEYTGLRELTDIHFDEVSVQKCRLEDMPVLCHSIIHELKKKSIFRKFAGTPDFTPEQYKCLYDHSGGIISHIQQALCNLMRQDLICCENGLLTSSYDWECTEVKQCIEDPVKKHIENIYKREKHNQTTLEHASILGEEFYSSYLNDIFHLNYDIQKILNQITEKYQILIPQKNLNRRKDWSFVNRLHHSKVYEFIERVENYHLSVADFLEKNEPRNYEEIERHLLVVGEQERAFPVRIKN